MAMHESGALSSSKTFGRIAGATLLALAFSAAAPNAQAKDVVITEAARTHFAAGVALLKDPKEPRYEEAYREFKAAYAASPSYKILGNLGLAAMKIERDEEAIHAFETYLKEGGPELQTSEREQVERDLLTLKTGIIRVTVSSDPPGATILDVRTPVTGEPVRNSYGQVLTPLSIGLRRGHHLITAKMPGFVDEQWEFEASGDELPPRVFRMTRPPTPERAVVHERPVPKGAYVAGGASIVLLAATGYFGVRALNYNKEYGTANTGADAANAADLRNKGQTMNIVTDAFLAGSVVVAGIAAYIVLSRPTVERQVGLVPQVSPMVGSRAGGANALWRF